MKYVPFCLMIAGTYYLFLHNIDGWGWSMLLTWLVGATTYAK